MPVHQPGPFGGGPLVEDLIRRPDGERPAVRHHVACIHDKIHDHLFELTSVGLHRAPLPHRADLELDLRTDQPAKHGCQIADDRVEVEHHRRQNLSTAESEKLPRQVGRVTARVENLDTSACVGSSGGKRSMMSWLNPTITVSRSLKSWATPPASNINGRRI